MILRFVYDDSLNINVGRILMFQNETCNDYFLKLIKMLTKSFLLLEYICKNKLQEIFISLSQNMTYDFIF